MVELVDLTCTAGIRLHSVRFVEWNFDKAHICLNLHTNRPYAIRFRPLLTRTHRILFWTEIALQIKIFIKQTKSGRPSAEYDQITICIMQMEIKLKYNI